MASQISARRFVNAIGPLPKLSLLHPSIWSQVSSILKKEILRGTNANKMKFSFQGQALITRRACFPGLSPETGPKQDASIVGKLGYEFSTQNVFKGQ